MAGPDLSLVTAAVDFSTVVEAVLYVAVAVLYVYVAWKGGKMLLEAVRGGEYLNNAGEVYTGRQLDSIWSKMDEAEKSDWGFESKADFLDLFNRVR